MAESLGLISESFAYENLRSGDFPIIPKEITIITGQNHTKGTLIGKITKVVGVAVAGVGNAGDGIFSAVVGGHKTKIGTYSLECVEVVAGRFKVIDPDGVRLDDTIVDVAYSNEHLGFTIAAGALDFIVGDTFTIAITAGSGKFTLALAASVDGSELYENMCILAKDTDASSADVTTTGWFSGQYNENKMIFGAGLTYDNSKNELCKYNIFLESATQA